MNVFSILSSNEEVHMYLPDFLIQADFTWQTFMLPDTKWPPGRRQVAVLPLWL